MPTTHGGVLKPELCVQAGQDSQVEDTAGKSQFLRRRDVESHSRRTGHRFQEMADLPELKCPGERGCFPGCGWKQPFSRKTGRWDGRGPRPVPRGPGQRERSPGGWFVTAGWLRPESTALESGRGMNGAPN